MLAAITRLFRPQPTKNVKARAVYFRGNFVYLGGSNASIVTGEMDEIHRKDTGQRILLFGYGLRTLKKQ